MGQFVGHDSVHFQMTRAMALRFPMEGERVGGGVAKAVVRSRAPVATIAPLAAAGLLIGQASLWGLNNTWLSVWAAVIQLAFAVLIVGTSDRRNRAVWPYVLGPGLILLGAMIWGALPRPGADPELARLELVKLMGMAAMMAMGVVVGSSRKGVPRFALFMAALALLYMAFALVIYRGDPAAVLGEAKGPHRWRFTGTFLNANAAGCLFGMLALLGLGLAQDQRRKLGRYVGRRRTLAIMSLGLACALGGGGAAALSGSRLSLLFTLIAGLVLLVADMRSSSSTDAPATKRSAMLRLALFAPLAVGALVSLGAVIERSAAPGSDLAWRWIGLSLDASAVPESPLLGHGLGEFSQVHAKLLTSGTANGVWDYNAAHSAALQALIEGGWPYLTLITLALAWPVAQIVALRRDMSGADAGVTHAALAAAGVALASGSLDIALNVPAIAALSLFLVGLVWGKVLLASTRRSSLQRADRRA